MRSLMMYWRELLLYLPLNNFAIAQSFQIPRIASTIFLTGSMSGDALLMTPVKASSNMGSIPFFCVGSLADISAI